MRKLLLGSVLGAALLGAGFIGSHAAQADPLLLDCTTFVSQCGANAVLPDPPLTGFDDPRIAFPPVGNPNPILDFGLIPRPSSGGLILPARGDMVNGRCDGRPCY